jgi:hypothetical protein
VIKGAGLQLRVGACGPYALDFPAILEFARAWGADEGLVAELLPEIEPLILARHARPEDEEGD